MAVFAMLGTVMFCSKIIMEALPNIHLLGMLTMVLTLTFRWRALIPIYVYVFLNGLYAIFFGRILWWFPYLYIWLILWAMTMLLPKKLPRKVKCVVLPIICCLHGLAFGTLYAPAQALMYGFTKEQTVAWIIAGLPWDLLHALSNLCVGFLIVPLSERLQKLMQRARLSV